MAGWTLNDQHFIWDIETYNSPEIAYYEYSTMEARDLGLDFADPELFRRRLITKRKPRDPPLNFCAPSFGLRLHHTANLEDYLDTWANLYDLKNLIPLPSTLLIFLPAELRALLRLYLAYTLHPQVSLTSRHYLVAPHGRTYRNLLSLRPFPNDVTHRLYWWKLSNLVLGVDLHDYHHLTWERSDPWDPATRSYILPPDHGMEEVD